ncbi:hypothetical protein T12_8555 [Trichinella patagoniensis]|uniref:Uncharacterized protein n=1 Tax=Trichinella patagoniensis TaxID=990121 RepID=A0A0V0YX32_9BILA|nr:hypothetical protein T12_9256 [Trichinella patagoniensis]KRY04974.1 hypothetical protein T12_8555 [Trichinella patagoniensis]
MGFQSSYSIPDLPQICSDEVGKGDSNTMAMSTTDKLPTAAAI